MNIKTFLLLFCLGLLVSCASHIEKPIEEEGPWERPQIMPEWR